MPLKLPALKALQKAAPNTSAQAHLLVASRIKVGAWLQALPVSSLGLRMEDDVLHVAVVPLCKSHKCQQCGTPVDGRGTHSLHCRKSGGMPCTSAHCMAPSTRATNCG